MNQFYVTLPSNTDPSNITSKFVVRLPNRIQLQGDWEVALVEITYPYTWNNVRAFTNVKGDIPDNQILLWVPARKAGKDYDVMFCDVSPGNYESILELLAVIKQSIYYESRVHYKKAILQIRRENAVSKKEVEPMSDLRVTRWERLHNAAKFEYDPISKRVTLTLDRGKVPMVKLSQHLAYMIGFTNRSMTNDDGPEVSIYPVDMLGGMDTLYVYCSLVENQIVGDTMAPLLRTVHVEGQNHGASVEKIFQTPHYIPVLNKDVDTIEINVKTDTGHFVPFEYGKTVVKLHFRKKRFFQ